MGASAATMTMLRVSLSAMGLTELPGLVPTDQLLARGIADNVTACLRIASGSERLACFDREVRKLVEPRFAGRLSAITERFRVDGPTLLRYQSDGAIFVLYLKSGTDEVVQNLHIGGGGEDTYLIEKPGTYFLQINGSESWRVWLEPQDTPSLE